MEFIRQENEKDLKPEGYCLGPARGLVVSRLRQWGAGMKKSKYMAYIHKKVNRAIILHIKCLLINKRISNYANDCFSLFNKCGKQRTSNKFVLSKSSNLNAPAG